jgi:DNA uptake protein ComE-like DNA-binding protein
MSSINPNALVIIRKQFVVGRNGNFYPEDRKTTRIASSIPPEYRTEEYLAIVGSPESETGSMKHITQIETEVEFDPPQTIEPKVVESMININTADVASLVALKHVGEAMASQIIAQRNEKPFDSIADLNTRVPMRGSYDWTTHATRLNFGV